MRIPNFIIVVVVGNIRSYVMCGVRAVCVDGVECGMWSEEQQEGGSRT